MSAESSSLEDQNYFSKATKSFTNFHELSLQQSIQDYDTWTEGSSSSSMSIKNTKDVSVSRKANVCIDGTDVNLASSSLKHESVSNKQGKEKAATTNPAWCHSSNALTLVSKSFCMPKLKKIDGDDWNHAETKNMPVKGKKSVCVNGAVSSILLRRAPSMVFEDVGGIATSNWPEGLVTSSQPNTSIPSTKQGESNMNSLDCWDYSMELECLNGQDGKVILKF